MTSPPSPAKNSGHRLRLLSVKVADEAWEAVHAMAREDHKRPRDVVQQAIAHYAEHRAMQSRKKQQDREQLAERLGSIMQNESTIGSTWAPPSGESQGPSSSIALLTGVPEPREASPSPRRTRRSSP